MKVNGTEALRYVQFYIALIINILEIQHQIFYQLFYTTLLSSFSRLL